MITCPECQSTDVKCIENGVEIKYKDTAITRCDMHKCLSCKECFATGFGYNAKEWGE